MQEFVSETDALTSERLIGWTIPDDESVWYLLFHGEGDVDAYRDALDEVDLVLEYDLTPVDGSSFYAYVVERIPPIESELLSAFAQGNLVVVPPVDFSDGLATITFVGPAEDQRRLIGSLPEEYVADVERIGEFDHRYASVAGRLTDRQREAVRAAFRVGYYGVPRDATLDDVAAELDCSAASASKLLRRAETALMSVVLEG